MQDGTAAVIAGAWLLPMVRICKSTRLNRAAVSTLRAFSNMVHPTRKSIVYGWKCGIDAIIQITKLIEIMAHEGSRSIHRGMISIISGMIWGRDPKAGHWNEKITMGHIARKIAFGHQEKYNSITREQIDICQLLEGRKRLLNGQQKSGYLGRLLGAGLRNMVGRLRMQSLGQSSKASRFHNSASPRETNSLDGALNRLADALAGSLFGIPNKQEVL
jgi:hypothetical protein